MMDGFFLIDKEPGWTSFGVCARVRNLLESSKAGHTGTLDPFATGLLVVATGKCTRLIPFLEGTVKTYHATVVLGKTSETLDPESEVTDVPLKGDAPSRDELEKLLQEQFIGKLQQVPPKFSAIKIEGRRSYQLARKGEEVELTERDTEVFRLEIHEYQFPEIKVELEVAAGFYVRSFARDLGAAFGGGGLCSELRRTGVGELSVNDAVKIEEVGEPIDPSAMLTQMGQVQIPADFIEGFQSGQRFPHQGESGQKVLVMHEDRTLGVGELIGGEVQPRVVL